MLPVSDLLEVARDERSGSDVGARAPQRFGSAGGPVIVWNVCRHCNMSCPHCYAAAAYRPSKEDLTTAEGRVLLEDLAACGVRVVIFSGGEPMLREDICELASYASSLGIAPQLSTNGVYIDDEAAARLARADFRYVGISIDGVPAFNDRYRGMEGGYAAALRGIDCAKAAGMRTGMRMTLTRLNCDQVGALLDVAVDHDVDRFYVSHLLYSGRGAKMAGDDLSRPESRAALEALFTAAEDLLDCQSPTRVVTGSNDSDGPLLLRWIEARYGEPRAKPVHDLLRERGGNSAGEKILNIDHKGLVHPDQFWRAETLGDVRREPFAKILAHPMRKALRGRAEKLEGRCGACHYREICRGSHRERAIAAGKGLWGPDPACVMEDAEIGVDAR
jgi:radical SAM protein with 4Fe4S-binding SPASM domain